MLELSDQGVKTTIIDKRTLLDRSENMHEWMGNVSREMQILRKNQKEMPDINKAL